MQAKPDERLSPLLRQLHNDNLKTPDVASSCVACGARHTRGVGTILRGSSAICSATSAPPIRRSSRDSHNLQGPSIAQRRPSNPGALRSRLIAPNRNAIRDLRGAMSYSDWLPVVIRATVSTTSLPFCPRRRAARKVCVGRPTSHRLAVGDLTSNDRRNYDSKPIPSKSVETRQLVTLCPRFARRHFVAYFIDSIHFKPMSGSACLEARGRSVSSARPVKPACGRLGDVAAWNLKAETTRQADVASRLGRGAARSCPLRSTCYSRCPRNVSIVAPGRE